MSTPDLSPTLTWIAKIRCEVGELLDLGPAPRGRRRVVPLLGGTVEGPELAGTIVPGGTDWQWHHGEPDAAGVITTELEAHYAIATPDGALIEVSSIGLRHGPAAVIASLAAGEPVEPSAYFFRTAIRFATGAPRWAHFNRTLAIAAGRREARRVILDVWRVG